MSLFRKKTKVEEERLLMGKKESTSLVAKKLSKEYNKNETIDLNNKIDNFINWYYENMIKDKYSKAYEIKELNDIRNFIEKMAVWYELRYPDYEINRILHCLGQEGKNINDIMFNKNLYINDILDENSDIRDLDWDEFYNAHAFISSLPYNEKWYLSKYKYNNVVYFDKKAHLHLTDNGTVYESESIDMSTDNVIKDFNVEGLKLEEVAKLCEEKNVKIPEDSEVLKEIENASNWKYQKEEILNCVMYRIIERGGNRIGPRRAFLFAKDFDRNIDIPMQYSIDYSDPGLRIFMNEYLKSGGSKDLTCYINYFGTEDKRNIKTVTISELVKTLSNNAATFYTPEEDELHQKLVNIFSSQINNEELKQIEHEKVKQLRLERRLEESRNR